MKPLKVNKQLHLDYEMGTRSQTAGVLHRDVWHNAATSIHISQLMDISSAHGIVSNGLKEYYETG